MRRAGVRHFYLHSITGIDPPELVYFQRANFQTYRDLGYLTYDVMYQYSMWQLMRIKKIPPLRKVRYCCEHLKERPVPQQGRAILSLGVRKYESVGRRKKRDELEIASDKKRGDNVIMPFDNSEKRRIFAVSYTHLPYHLQRFSRAFVESGNLSWGKGKRSETARFQTHILRSFLAKVDTAGG